MAKGVKQHNLDELDIMDLRVIRAMHRYQNTQDAAHALRVTQPAVTYRVQLIENYFQQSLYYRRTKGDSFTPFGNMLAKYADEILDLYSEMMIQARSFNKEKRNVDIHERLVPFSSREQGGPVDPSDQSKG